MIKHKSFKSIFLTSILTIGISAIASQNSFAATLTNYTVKSGDCMSVIAQKHGVSLSNLRKANKNCSISIFPGQILKVPGATSSTVAKATPMVAKRIVAKNNVIKYTASDLNLLSRLITAEAQGETYKAQVAVGAVVINRVQSSRFPNSIKAVINQKSNGYYQFSPIQNGSIKKPAQATAVKAAKAALKGTDPTKNALFFYSGISPVALTSQQPASIKIDSLTFVGIAK